MFSLDVVDTDAFLDLPASSQSLYFHLGLRADDDGFISSPRRIASTVNASTDDLKLLIAKASSSRLPLVYVSFGTGKLTITSNGTDTVRHSMLRRKASWNQAKMEDICWRIQNVYRMYPNRIRRIG